MSDLKPGDLVWHMHRAKPGEVRAVADGYAMVKWPDWRTPDLCPASDLSEWSPPGGKKR